MEILFKIKKNRIILFFLKVLSLNPSCVDRTQGSCYDLNAIYVRIDR